MNLFPLLQELQAWQRCDWRGDGECPLLARAGWGARLAGPAGPQGSSGPVDGPQTAQRAELTAAVHAVSLAAGPVEVMTDS
eukprot:3421353-Pyramimonas_sp.AAC.1